MSKRSKAADGNGRPSGSTAQRYREKWNWDKTAWATHCINCYPGNCQYRVYGKDGKIVREEQAGTYKPIEAGVPDMNPMGCHAAPRQPGRLLHARWGNR